MAATDFRLHTAGSASAYLSNYSSSALLLTLAPCRQVHHLWHPTTPTNDPHDFFIAIVDFLMLYGRGYQCPVPGPEVLTYGAASETREPYPDTA